MEFHELLNNALPWITWSGIFFTVITIFAYLLGWDIRFRLVGISSFTFLLAVSCWSFGVSYTPSIKVEGAVRVPIVFDNGKDLVVAQAPQSLKESEIGPTLEQLSMNLRGSGRNKGEVHLRLRRLQPVAEGVSKPVIIGEKVRNFGNN